VFTKRNLIADFFYQKLDFTCNTAKSRFVPLFGGVRGNVHGSSMARWKPHGRLPVSASWTVFATSHGWDAMSGYFSKSWCTKGSGSFWVQVSGGLGSPTKDCWRQKTRVPGLSYGVVCVILRLAVLTQYRRVTDRQTHRQRRLIPAQS